jgi:hypothetical protein
MSSTLADALRDIGACRDSPLSITSAVLSIVTFFYAIALGSYFITKTSRESNDSFDKITRATEYARLELEVSRQNFAKSVEREELIYGRRYGMESDQRMRNDQMHELFKKASLQFEKWDKLLKAFKEMFPGHQKERPSYRGVNEWGFLHDLDKTFEAIGNYCDPGLWKHNLRRGFGWLISFVVYFPLLIAFYLSRAFTWSLLRSIGWRLQVWKWPRHIRWVLKQEELLIMMRETEDAMSQIRSAEFRR